MGYRSDGNIRIRGPYEFMLTQIAHLNVTGNDSVRQVLKDEFILTKKDGDTPEKPFLMMSLDYSQWKWYSEYEDVQAFETIWSHFCDLHEETDSTAENYEATLLIDGAFVRLGEDESDVETRYFGDDPYELVRPYRGIECSSYPERSEDIRHNRISLDDTKKTT